MRIQPRFLRLMLALASAILLAVGCPSPEPVEDAGPDGGGPAHDGGIPFDAGFRVDGGVDGGPATADAGPPPPECTVGGLRTASCGFCGTEAQECEEPGTWVATSECLGQGECAAGTVETRDLGLCAQEQRICVADCTWSEWEESRGPGECEPGDTRRVMHATCAASERLVEQCNTACSWDVGVGACVDPCGPSPLRTAPEWAREVCVPDGEFVHGLEEDGWLPEANIYVSTFYIDVYPVTNRRYQQCVTAGSCAPADGTYARSTPEYLDYPVQGISRNEAVAFCAWDGGRRLVTGAEWQKAARGPAPRRNRYPWGDSLDCSIVDTGLSPCDAAGLPDRYAADPFDAFSASSASYYGAQMMGFGVQEWALDAYCTNWDTLPEALLHDPVCDPGNPDAGGWLGVSGHRRSVRTLMHRGFDFRPDDEDLRWWGFRCGRRP